eukprot:GFUD01038134.1.p1 GENE.GFUD01038134.1~~GFUD01038134.1.p1  ORF type:complete len:1100 (+),score=250.55 GFUD01038134.1:169-3468(+)
MSCFHCLQLVIGIGLFFVHTSTGGFLSGFGSLAKGVFNAAELTSNALEATCLGVSIAELHFDCGSIFGSTCSALQEQGKKTQKLLKKSNSMAGHKHVVDKMNMQNSNNMLEIERINSMVMELAKDGLRNIKMEGVEVITNREVRDLRQQMLRPAGSDTLDTFQSVTYLKINLTKFAERFKTRSKTEEERMANDLKFNAVVFGVQLAFGLGPKLVPWLTRTYNLKNAHLLVLDTEFSKADGGLTKFKQAVDARTGKSYILQYININGQDVVQNSIKINPYDNSKLDLLHNYGLSATDRAEAVDYLKKNPYTGPSTLQTVFDNPEFMDRIKDSNNMQAVFEEIKTRKHNDASITQKEIDNADLNQLVDRQNNDHALARIKGNDPIEPNMVDGTKHKHTTLERLRFWWKSKKTGDPNFGAKATLLMLEYPQLAEYLRKSKAMDTVMNQIASKEDDIDATRIFLDRLDNKMKTNEFVSVGQKAKKNGIHINNEDIKLICLEERHLKQILKNNPDVNENKLRNIIQEVKNEKPSKINTDRLYYATYKESWTKNREILDGDHRNLKDNINSNDAKGFLMKALNMLPNPEKIKNYLTVLRNNINKVTNQEIKKILKENDIKGVTPEKIAAFRNAYNSASKGLFSKADQGGTDAYFNKMISQHLGINSDQTNSFIDGMKNEKSLTKEKMKKIAKKRGFNLGSLDLKTYVRSSNSYTPLDTKFATIGQKITSWGTNKWSGSSSDDLKAGWENAKKSWKASKLASSFNVFTSVVGAASTGLSYYTCAYQQLGSLYSREDEFKKEIEEGKKDIKEFEVQVTTLETAIKARKKTAIKFHCKLSEKFVSFLLEVTGNMDKQVKPCSEVTVSNPEMIGRKLTYTAIAECYGEFKEDNPYKGTECKNIEEIPEISLDYTDHQEFLSNRLMAMSTFLQKQKDIIASALNHLVLRYNIESLTKEDSSVNKITRLLKNYGFREEMDFTKFSILKIISQTVINKHVYQGYPLGCIRKDIIVDDTSLNKWMEENLNFDTEKLVEFTEAVEDGETVEYLRKKARKGKYHFSTTKTMSDTAVDARIMKEIANRVLASAAVYIDEDKKSYILKPYRSQQSAC